MSLSESDIRVEAWNKAVEACGTGAIFARRAQTIGKLGKIRDFLGIFIPVCVGIIVADVSLGSKYLQILIGVTAMPSLAQAALSVWSLVAGWNENYVKCVNSQGKNNALRREWEALGRGAAPATASAFESLSTKTSEQEQADLALTPTEKERRYGMRYALKDFRRQCATCGEVPLTLKPSRCDTCGNF